MMLHHVIAHLNLVDFFTMPTSLSVTDPRSPRLFMMAIAHL
ncbi:MAG TPA: hypothetical protein V6D20_17485 [Candidatus Obscuribacterales bacterium]